MGEDAQDERRKRLADALRANLKRRRAQKRERSAGEETREGHGEASGETG